MNSKQISSGGVQTCARLILGSHISPLFVKGSWFPDHFNLSISDGSHCWTCTGAPGAVAERAAGWDESIRDYLQRAQLYLSHQHPNSSYSFIVDGENRKLSWTFIKHGTKLEWKWKCEKAENEQHLTCDILNFLMDSNIKLSEEMLRKTQSFERMKEEAQKCLEQAERFKNDKMQFEADVFKKFVVVLNSKKAKLRELRDKLATLEPKSEREEAQSESGDDTDNEKEEDGEEEEDDDDSKKKSKSKEEYRKEEVSTQVPLASTSASSSQMVVHDDVKMDTSREALLSQEAKMKDTDKDIKSSPELDSVVALLTEPTYTSAPKRRRHL